MTTTRRPMINADATIENVEFLVADGVHPTQIAARTGYKHVDHLIHMLRRKQRDDLANQLLADRDELRVGAGARKGRLREFERALIALKRQYGHLKEFDQMVRAQLDEGDAA